MNDENYYDRMQAAFTRLALVNYFILVGSRTATNRQQAAAVRIQAKLHELARRF